MKIAVYTIAKNEEKHVERWYNSSSDADIHLILDTGSSDKTIEIAKSLGIIVDQKIFDPFKFDEARNAALDMVPGDIDFCISLDMDEVLLDGWREQLESSIIDQPNCTQFEYQFINSRLPDGSPLQTWGRVNVHQRHGARWKWPIHEIVYTTPYVLGKTNMLSEHMPDLSKPREYLKMLEDAAKENPKDSRISFYYGRELYYHNMFDKAYIELKRCATLGGWSYEVSEAYLLAARCMPSEAESLLFKACSITPDRREPFVELAELYYNESRWIPALGMADRAMSMSKNPTYISENKAWNFYIYDIAALCAYNIGNKDLAISYGEKALSMDKDNDRLRENLNWYRS